MASCQVVFPLQEEGHLLNSTLPFFQSMSGLWERSQVIPMTISLLPMLVTKNHSYEACRFVETKELSTMSDGGGIEGIVGIVSVDGLREFHFGNTVIFDKILGDVGGRSA